MVDESIKVTATEKKAECSVCGGIRNCDILGAHRESGGDGYFDWIKDWSLLRCRGCEHIFVQTISSNSEDYVHGYDENGDEYQNYSETFSYWPAISKRKLPEWMSDSGIAGENVTELNTALIEVYGALNSDLRILTAIGVRTAFDVAAEILEVDANLPFSKKLDALVAGAHIGIVDRERLLSLIDAGSASAHRGWKPKAADIDLMIDVLEHFVHDAFVAPARKLKMNSDMAKLRAKVPKRPAKLRSAKAAKAGAKAATLPAPSGEK